MWENDGTFHLMRRVMQRHNALWRERLPELTPVQFAVLLSARRLSGADQQTVGAAAAVEPTTMANLVARMERAGLIVRSPDAADGRRHCLSLSPAGRQALSAAAPVVGAIRDDCLAVIPEADARQLAHILRALATADESPSDVPNNRKAESMTENSSISVSTAAELVEALQGGHQDIEVVGTISGSPMITLPPGTTLRGGTLRFGAKGVRLTADNTLDDIVIETADDEVAVLNDTSLTDWGTLTLRNVTTRGQVLLLAQDQLRAGHVVADGVRVAAADGRGRSERPHGFGVDALQGGFTLWNRQADPAVETTAEPLDVSAGSEAGPVHGSGVFVGGFGDWEGKAAGGTVRVSKLRTGEIHTDGGIPESTPDLISGGVFVISGAIVESVVSAGAVTTYGQNDMVLDNWGTVTTWTATAPITSHGPSGIGFVNFGDIDTIDVQAPLVTTGKGARGFNLYDGSLREARFAGISTTGDGSVGVQVSKPMGSLLVDGDVTTGGGEGLSLVKGVQVDLQAIALSVKEGGSIESITIAGRLATSGDNVTTVEIEGEVGHLAVGGGIDASGAGSDAVHLAGDGLDLAGIAITSAHGEQVVRDQSC